MIRVASCRHSDEGMEKKTTQDSGQHASRSLRRASRIPHLTTVEVRSDGPHRRTTRPRLALLLQLGRAPERIWTTDLCWCGCRLFFYIDVEDIECRNAGPTVDPIVDPTIDPTIDPSANHKGGRDVGTIKTESIGVVSAKTNWKSTSRTSCQMSMKVRELSST